MPNPLVISELARIAQDSGGLLRAEDVVEAARPTESPLHEHFTWDNDAAAHAYRIWQARQLIRVTVFMVEKQIGRVYVSLSPDRTMEGGGYRAMVAVLSNKEHRAQLMQDAMEEMKRFEQKYAALHELDRVFQEMRRAREKQNRRLKPRTRVAEQKGRTVKMTV